MIRIAYITNPEVGNILRDMKKDDTLLLYFSGEQNVPVGEIQAFMSTKRNSFHLSVHFSIGMIIFAAIDAILLLVLTILQASSVVPGTVEVTEEIADAALAEGLRVAVAVGLGGSISLAFVAPLMLLYSYNSEPKNKMISMLIPVVGIVLMVIVVLEAGRKGVGMFMAGRQIDLDAIRDALKQLVAQ